MLLFHVKRPHSGGDISHRDVKDLKPWELRDVRAEAVNTDSLIVTTTLSEPLDRDPPWVWTRDLTRVRNCQGRLCQSDNDTLTSLYAAGQDEGKRRQACEGS